MKRLNKIVVLALFGLWGATSLAQGPARDRIKTLKVAYITDELELTSEEAQLFWPIYNEHEDNLENIRLGERLRFAGRFENISEISDTDASKMINAFLDFQKQKLEEDKRFISELKNVIPDKKIIRLLRAEEGFKKRLLQQFRHRRGNK